jgi:hypothetical protein
MIGQYLSNKNENTTVAKSEIFSELNNTLVRSRSLVDWSGLCASGSVGGGGSVWVG